MDYRCGKDEKTCFSFGVGVLKLSLILKDILFLMSLDCRVFLTVEVGRWLFLLK